MRSLSIQPIVHGIYNGGDMGILMFVNTQNLINNLRIACSLVVRTILLTSMVHTYELSRKCRVIKYVFASCTLKRMDLKLFFLATR